MKKHEASNAFRCFFFVKLHSSKPGGSGYALFSVFHGSHSVVELEVSVEGAKGGIAAFQGAIKGALVCVAEQMGGVIQPSDIKVLIIGYVHFSFKEP